MCGIAGLWDAPGAEVAPMLSALVHRGPDGRGDLSLGRNRALGHQRLSIVDVTGGAQPFVRRAEGDKVASSLVANGEIYNSPSLRTELAGAPFTSESDCEVILHLLDGGVGEVDRLRGMYAFAWSDGHELVLGRDPLGIKPLYVGTLDGGTVFASELKAFPAGSRDVQAVPPGTTRSSTSGDRHHWTVPAPPVADESTVTLEDAGRRVRDALEEAVVSHLMADVPVGAFLSGGLDSSALCALMRRHVDDFHTFAVGVEGSPDLAAARLVADHLGTNHHEFVLEPSAVAAAVPGVVVGLESFDQDLVRSAVPTWFVARLAAEHVKVVLTGEGADELFAGYAYHKAIADPVALQTETRRSLAELHHVNLQRVDRMTMAHSLEARVPFLDTAMIETTLALAPALRMPSVGGLEKTLLRLAVEDLLPAEAVWRDKAQFDEGSGTDKLLPALHELLAGQDVDAYRIANSGTALRSAEECRYHQLLSTGVDHPEVVLPTVARWADRNVA